MVSPSVTAKASARPSAASANWGLTPRNARPIELNPRSMSPLDSATRSILSSALLALSAKSSKLDAPLLAALAASLAAFLDASALFLAAFSACFSCLSKADTIFLASWSVMLGMVFNFAIKSCKLAL